MGVFRSVTAKERDQNPPRPPPNSCSFSIMGLHLFRNQAMAVRSRQGAPNLRQPLKRWLSNSAQHADLNTVLRFCCQPFHEPVCKTEKAPWLSIRSVRVRVPSGSPNSMLPSSSGLGRNFLKVDTRVQISLGVPFNANRQNMVISLLMKLTRVRSFVG